MLIITDASLGLVKHHVKQNNEDGRIIKCIRSSCFKDTAEALLLGVDYDEEGELTPVTCIVEHTGAQIITKDYKQDANNKTYLVVPEAHVYSHLRSKEVKHLSLTPSQYQHEVLWMSALMEPDAWPYFWSEYCIGKFRSNPVKWYNEGRYLLFLFKERDKKKFSREDLDFLYHKVTDTAKDYLRHMYTENAKSYILKMSVNELFITFIRGPKYKSSVQKSLEELRPEMLTAYMIMKEAFYKAKIRLTEAVIIFDYLLNKETKKDTTQIRNLFNLK